MCIHRFASIVAAIDALAPTMASMTDEALAGQTRVLRDRVTAGASLDDVLVEAFAVVREAATRVLGQRPYLVQLVCLCVCIRVCLRVCGCLHIHAPPTPPTCTCSLVASSCMRGV